MSVITTSDVQCFVNGVLFAQVSNFSFDSTTNIKEVFALDSPVPYELMPTTTMVTGTCNVYRQSGDGGLEGAGLTTSFDQFPRQQYITIALKQISTDLFIFQARYCVVLHQTWGMPAKNIVTGQFSFRGLIWSNEVAGLST